MGSWHGDETNDHHEMEMTIATIAGR